MQATAKQPFPGGGPTGQRPSRTAVAAASASPPVCMPAARSAARGGGGGGKWPAAGRPTTQKRAHPGAADHAFFNVGAGPKQHLIFKNFLLRSDNPVFRAVAFFVSTAILKPVLRAFSMPRFLVGSVSLPRFWWVRSPCARARQLVPRAQRFLVANARVGGQPGAGENAIPVPDPLRIGAYKPKIPAARPKHKQVASRAHNKKEHRAARGAARAKKKE